MDKTQFEALTRAHWQDVLAYALRRTSDPADAADVVAEVFLVAWRRRESIPLGQDARLWLFGVARLTVTNQRRGEIRRTRLNARVTATISEAQIPAGSDPADDVVRREEAHRLGRAFQGLPERDAELLRLTAWEGLTPAQASVVLGLSPGLARVRLHRARERLRALLLEPPQRPVSTGHVLLDGYQPVTAKESF